MPLQSGHCTPLRQQVQGRAAQRALRHPLLCGRTLRL